MRARPCTLRFANTFVAQHHRHHKPDRGHKFSVSAVSGDSVVGVAICGRPKARALDSGRDGLVLEVTHLCTDGSRNACSFLYGVCARIAREMGFAEIVTYTLQTECGASLRATGWLCDGVVRPDGKGWSNRPGRENVNPETKVRWRKVSLR